METTNVEEAKKLIRDFGKICRFCLCSGELTSLFDNGRADTFFRLTLIEVSPTDNLPKNICELCLNDLKTFNNFVKKCKYAHEFLKEVLVTAKLGVEKPMIESLIPPVSAPALNSNSNIKLVLFNSDVPLMVDSSPYRKIAPKPVAIQLISNSSNPNQHPIASKANNGSLAVKQPRIAPANNSNTPTTTSTASKENTEFVENAKRPRMQKTVYRCNLCEHESEVLLEIVNHMKETHQTTKTVQANFQCPHCKEMFRHKGTLNSHIQALHSDGSERKSFKATTTAQELTDKIGKSPIVKQDHSSKFATSSNQNKKKNNNHNNHIPHNNFKTNNRGGTVPHIKCPDCPQLFPSYLSLKMHSRVHVRLHDCAVCRTKFSSSAQLKRHMATHLEANQFKCNLCDIHFATRYQRLEHQKGHSLIVKKFSCDECNAKFRTRGLLYGHKRTDHDCNSYFDCKSCSKAFETGFRLQVHFMLKHKTDNEFICIVCNKLLENRFEFDKHVRKHKSEPNVMEVVKEDLDNLNSEMYPEAVEEILLVHENEDQAYLLEQEQCVEKCLIEEEPPQDKQERTEVEDQEQHIEERSRTEVLEEDRIYLDQGDGFFYVQVHSDDETEASSNKRNCLESSVEELETCHEFIAEEVVVDNGEYFDFL